MPFLHAEFARASIFGTSTTPETFSSSRASTVASATTSALSGFVPPAPISHVSLPPVTELATAPMAVTPARPIVIGLDESYNMPGLMKILLMRGNLDAIVDSASLLVWMYL